MWQVADLFDILQQICAEAVELGVKNDRLGTAVPFRH